MSQGKGSVRRPGDEAKYQSEYDRIFRPSTLSETITTDKGGSSVRGAKPLRSTGPSAAESAFVQLGRRILESRHGDAPVAVARIQLERSRTITWPSFRVFTFDDGGPLTYRIVRKSAWPGVYLCRRIALPGDPKEW